MVLSDGRRGHCRRLPVAELLLSRVPHVRVVTHTRSKPWRIDIEPDPIAVVRTLFAVAEIGKGNQPARQRLGRGWGIR